MSQVGKPGRSYESIGVEDLRRLAAIARRDGRAFFLDHAAWRRLYSRRVLCIALCQGAAMHYIDGQTGINDFDVYTFYREHPLKAWYAKRIKSYDFGNSKFGQSVDRPDFLGRRVDCLGRSIVAQPGDSAEDAVRRYLREGHTETARLLAEKAVILLQPRCGKVVWPA